MFVVLFVWCCLQGVAQNALDDRNPLTQPRCCCVVQTRAATLEALGVKESDFLVLMVRAPKKKKASASASAASATPVAEDKPDTEPKAEEKKEEKNEGEEKKAGEEKKEGDEKKEEGKSDEAKPAESGSGDAMQAAASNVVMGEQTDEVIANIMAMVSLYFFGFFFFLLF